MDAWEQKVKDRLKALPKLSSSALESNVLSKISQENNRKKNRRRVQQGLSIAACIACAGIGIGTLSLHSAAIPKPLNAIQPSKQPFAQAFGQVDWWMSPLQTVEGPTVTQLGKNTDFPVSDRNPVVQITVDAKVKNTATNETLSNVNTQGLLLFFQDGVQVASYFVDAPNQPLAPGQSAEWKFQPMSSSWPAHLDHVQAKLTFIRRINWTPTQSVLPSKPQPTVEIPSLGWKIGRSPLQVTMLDFTGYGQNNMYMQIRADVYNPTNEALRDQNLMGFIFLPKDSTSSALDDYTFKYMVDVSFLHGEIAPKTHQTVTFKFVGNASLDLIHRTPSILIVSKATLPKGDN